MKRRRERGFIIKVYQLRRIGSSKKQKRKERKREITFTVTAIITEKVKIYVGRGEGEKQEHTFTHCKPYYEMRCVRDNFNFIRAPRRPSVAAREWRINCSRASSSCIFLLFYTHDARVFDERFPTTLVGRIVRVPWTRYIFSPWIYREYVLDTCNVVYIIGLEGK